MVIPTTGNVAKSENARTMTQYISEVRNIAPALLKADRRGKRALVKSNATASPFLRLPPEIRNEIYKLVLTGKTIHVWGNDFKDNLHLSLKRRLIRSACFHGEDEVNEATRLQAERDDTRKRDMFWMRHVHCRRHHAGQPRSQFNLSLLQTCRQTHQDAALLFYQENTFSFSYVIDLEAFLEFLIPVQVKAIQKISIYHSYNFKSNAAYEMRLKSKIGTLRQLTLFVKEAIISQQQTDLAAGCLMRFQRLSIDAVTVAARWQHHAWTKQIEENLKREFVATKRPKRAVNAKVSEETAATKKDPTRDGTEAGE